MRSDVTEDGLTKLLDLVTDYFDLQLDQNESSFIGLELIPLFLYLVFVHDMPLTDRERAKKYHFIFWERVKRGPCPCYNDEYYDEVNLDDSSEERDLQEDATAFTAKKGEDDSKEEEDPFCRDYVTWISQLTTHAEHFERFDLLQYLIHIKFETILE